MVVRKILSSSSSGGGVGFGSGKVRLGLSDDSALGRCCRRCYCTLTESRCRICGGFVAMYVGPF